MRNIIRKVLKRMNERRQLAVLAVGILPKDREVMNQKEKYEQILHNYFDGETFEIEEQVLLF